jgi:hypothetical protein
VVPFSVDTHIEYLDGYLIYAAGFTLRAAPERFREHTRKYLKGEYNVLEVSAIQHGVRKEVWHGWSYARSHREEFLQHKAIILEAVRKELAAFRIFIAEVGTDRRLLERLEAAIMNTLYQGLPPLSTIPDQGMFLAPRRSSESPIIVKNLCSVRLHGLPTLLEI